MKIRRLSEIDLARIAPLPTEEKSLACAFSRLRGLLTVIVLSGQSFVNS